MRVLFVSQEFPPETGWGGIGTYVDVLSHALANRGVDVHVLSVVQGQPAGTSNIGGVIVHRRSLPRMRGPGRLAPETWRRIWLPTVVARVTARLPFCPTVVECPEWNAEGLILGLQGTLPLVVRLHSSARQLFAYTGQGGACLGLDARIAARLEDLSARRANVLISSASNFAEVSEWMRLDARALHVIPIPTAGRPSTPLEHTPEPRVTFIGRLEPRKGPELLLRAAPKVLAAVPAATFAFVGRDGGPPGTTSTTLSLRREAERLGIAHAIDLPGQLDRDGVTVQLQRATVCAFPSHWECTPNVIAEAAMARRPVVVSAIPAFQELVQDRVTGRIVPLEDTDAWAAALIEILSDGQRARAMGEAAASLVADYNDPSRVVDLTLAAYEHAVQRWRRDERAGRLTG